ncbi:MAG: fumarylacetoacetate hydrolase family protein [Pseudoclavibacter sp.]
MPDTTQAATQAGLTAPAAHTGPDAPFAIARYREPAGGADAGGATGASGEPRVGLVAGDRIRPLGADDLGAATLNEFLAAGDWNRLEALAAEAGDATPWRPLAEVVLAAPVEPRQVLQAGANYRQHVIELVASGLRKKDDLTEAEARERAGKVMDARAASGRPFIFLGLPQCVVGDDVPLVLPADAETHDWELELAIVIGREAFRVSRDDAFDYIAGFTIVNDITTRELVFPGDVGDIGADWYRAKNARGFLPTGPFLVPAQFVEANDASVKLDLNGEVMQDASTSDLLFGIAAIIEEASKTLPLLPGDLVLTGSPAGNGQFWGRFLRDGDVMTGTVANLGTQTVRCVAE